MNRISTKPEEAPARSRKNHALIMLWIFLWMVTFVAADKAEAYEWYTAGSLSLLAIAINAVIGVIALLGGGYSAGLLIGRARYQ